MKFGLPFFGKQFRKGSPEPPPKFLSLRELEFLYLTLLQVLDILKLMSEETPKPGRPKSARNQSRITKSKTVAEEQLLEVFDYWVEQCKGSARRKPILDSTRRLVIGAAIHDYGVAACKEAILGCTMSDFHMGRNKNGKKYDDIELILRDAKHIEQFLDIYDKGQDKGVDW